MNTSDIEQRIVSLTEALIRRPSVSPEDAGCQQLLADRLAPLAFKNESLFFTDTSNLWSVRGEHGPLFVFAGHTDVVPAGPLEKWQSPPFEPTQKDGFIVGRGAADMKGSLAAMIVAVEEFVKAHPHHKGRIAFLITSDEEDKWVNGTVKVVETLQARGEQLTYCVVGEPSSTSRVGDVIKIGRRGSITGKLHIHGKQGHVAYPHLADNAVHKALPVLNDLVDIKWDEGNQHFPPSSFQITRLQAGHANNVVPGEVMVEFNMRYSTEQSSQGIQERVRHVCKRHHIECDEEWSLSGDPFLTEKGELLDVSRSVIESLCGYTPEFNTKGGTSDGRFIAKTGAQVIELGPCNATIHQVNESVRINDLLILSQLYFGILKNLLA